MVVGNGDTKYVTYPVLFKMIIPLLVVLISGAFAFSAEKVGIREYEKWVEVTEQRAEDSAKVAKERAERIERAAKERSIKLEKKVDRIIELMERRNASLLR